MSAASLAERARLGRLMAVNAWHAFNRRLTYYSVSWDALSVFDSAELTLVPQDIRTADPTIAEDIYSGRFAFAGEVIEERTESPFWIHPPSSAWAEELHSFSWLRHLRASEKAIAQVNAQALVLDWIDSTKLDNIYAWLPNVLATRILAWISQSPLILADCDRAFYQKFARSLSRQVRFLRKSINNVPDGLPRLKATLALTAASIAISNQSRFRRPSLRRLDQELQRQILPDGGHFSRNPLPIVEILLDLLPLRQAIIATQLVPSQTLMNSIDRMIPMIRFFQMGDGAFARFNGMGGTPVDMLAAILAHDDARGTPPFNASLSGYQRMQSGETILIMDTGGPPPAAVSNKAHAGCLSFEMSIGNRPLIINCGVPPETNGTLRRLARTTAAHSTLTIDNQSSCRFASLTRYTAVHGVPILSGPSMPDVTREDAGGTTFVSTRHDGYKRTNGFVHERSITLHEGGQLVEGIDSLSQSNQKPDDPGHDYVIRFHLHPFVKPGPVEEGGIVRLSLRGGQIWHFAAPGSEIEVEDSVFLSEMVGSLQSQQIVIHGKTAARLTVSWRLERMEDMEMLGDFADLDLAEYLDDDDIGSGVDVGGEDASDGMDTDAVVMAPILGAYAAGELQAEEFEQGEHEAGELEPGEFEPAEFELGEFEQNEIDLSGPPELDVGPDSVMSVPDEDRIIDPPAEDFTEDISVEVSADQAEVSGSTTSQESAKVPLNEQFEYDDWDDAPAEIPDPIDIQTQDPPFSDEPVNPEPNDAEPVGDIQADDPQIVEPSSADMSTDNIPSETVEAENVSSTDFSADEDPLDDVLLVDALFGEDQIVGAQVSEDLIGEDLTGEKPASKDQANDDPVEDQPEGETTEDVPSEAEQIEEDIADNGATDDVSPETISSDDDPGNESPTDDIANPDEPTDKAEIEAPVMDAKDADAKDADAKDGDAKGGDAEDRDAEDEDANTAETKDEDEQTGTPDKEVKASSDSLPPPVGPPATFDEPEDLSDPDAEVRPVGPSSSNEDSAPEVKL